MTSQSVFMPAVPLANMAHAHAHAQQNLHIHMGTKPETACYGTWTCHCQWDVIQRASKAVATVKVYLEAMATQQQQSSSQAGRLARIIWLQFSFETCFGKQLADNLLCSRCSTSTCANQQKNMCWLDQVPRAAAAPCGFGGSHALTQQVALKVSFHAALCNPHNPTCTWADDRSLLL